MKKLLALLAIIALPILGQSQSFGIKGGLISSNMNEPVFVDNKRLNSPIVGLFYTQEFKRFRLSIEPSYAPKGFRNTLSFADQSGNLISNEVVKYKWRYIEVPISLGYNIIDKDLFWGVNLGVSPGFLLSAKAQSTHMDFRLNGNNSFVFDMLAGTYLGYKINDKIYATINLRYGHSLIGPVKPTSEFNYSYFSPFVTVGYKLK